MELNTKASENWQQRRSEFNHNWLKNTYHGYILRFHKILDGATKDQEDGVRLFLEKFPEWEQRRVELKELINEYGDLLSPKSLLNINPLSNLSEEDKLWMGEVINERWMSKYNVPEQIKIAEECLEKVDLSYDILKKRMENVKILQDISDKDGCKKEVETFRDACVELGSAVNRFHNRIRIF